MIISVSPTRRDGKTPVSFKFDNGRITRQLIPNKDYPNMEALAAKYPDAQWLTISGRR